MEITLFMIKSNEGTVIEIKIYSNKLWELVVVSIDCDSRIQMHNCNGEDGMSYVNLDDDGHRPARQQIIE